MRKPVVWFAILSLLVLAACSSARRRLSVARDGKRIFCSGAGDETVHAFSFADGYLTDHQAIRLRPAKQRAIPAGLCASGDGKMLYVANVWGHRITQIDLETQGVRGEI